MIGGKCRRDRGLSFSIFFENFFFEIGCAGSWSLILHDFTNLPGFWRSNPIVTIGEPIYTIIIMENITLSIEEDVIQAVRRYAAAQDSTVHKLVQDFLRSIAEQETRAKAARERMTKLSNSSSGRMGEKNWNREDLHER